MNPGGRLFASVGLAARVERAERALIADSVHAIRRGRPEAFVIEIAGGAACYAAPGSPLNKVVGLGFGGPVDGAALNEIETAYAARSSPVQVEVSTLADAGIGDTLTARGYRLVGAEHVLGCALPAASLPAIAAEIRIERPEDLDAWLDVVVGGFAAPDEEGVPSHESFPREVVESAIRDMGAAAGVSHYLAAIGDQSAGGASMRMHDGVAILCGAATLPDFRRRGVQTALLRQRLADASAAGCALAVVTTQPGSPSHRNAQQRGFELLYARIVLVKGR